MDKSLKCLKDLVHSVSNYKGFEAKAIAWRHWYLVGLQTWTKENLWAFYGQNGGR